MASSYSCGPQRLKGWVGGSNISLPPLPPPHSNGCLLPLSSDRRLRALFCRPLPNPRKKEQGVACLSPFSSCWTRSDQKVGFPDEILQWVPSQCSFLPERWILPPAPYPIPIVSCVLHLCFVWQVHALLNNFRVRKRVNRPSAIVALFGEVWNTHCELDQNSRVGRIDILT